MVVVLCKTPPRAYSSTHIVGWHVYNSLLHGIWYIGYLQTSVYCGKYLEYHSCNIHYCPNSNIWPIITNLGSWNKHIGTHMSTEISLLTDDSLPHGLVCVLVDMFERTNVIKHLSCSFYLFHGSIIVYKPSSKTVCAVCSLYFQVISWYRYINSSITL